MFMRSMVACLSLAFHPFAEQALAGETSAPAGTLLYETRATSDAFDDGSGIADQVMTLRGAFEVSSDTELGHLGFSAGLNVEEYRRLRFLSDRAALASMVLAREFADSIVLRSKIGYRGESDGDFIRIADFILPTRTPVNIFDGSLDAAWSPSKKLALSASFVQSYELRGATDFGPGLPDTRISPDVATTRAGLTLRLAAGNNSAFVAQSRTVVVAPYRAPLAALRIGSARIELAAGYETVLANGAEAAASFGAVFLTDDLNVAEGYYPTYKLAIKRAVSERSASLTVSGDIDTDDTDDPLASYVHRAELEATWGPSVPWRFRAGLFAEWRDNLALGNWEKAAGIYTSVAFTPADSRTLLLRIDYDERFVSGPDIRNPTLTASLGLQIGI